jgi:hypothetical protein
VKERPLVRVRFNAGLGRTLPIADADTNDTYDDADNRWPEREKEQ